VNTIFTSSPNPFIFSDIPFQPCQAAIRSKPESKNNPPLKLWYLDDEHAASLNKTDAEKRIALEVAGEIAAITTGTNPITARGDIAVLVRTNRQAQIIKDHLSAKEIPSVVLGSGNVFLTKEAVELYRILSAVAEPNNIRRIRAALSTDLIGISGDHLLRNKEPGSNREDLVLINFNPYLELWEQDGFMTMFSCLTSWEGVRERLAALSDGERRLTNLNQLSELLHEASVKDKLGISGLLQWFAERQNQVKVLNEAYQLRMESDAHAVKIITIHKSKGLQFPVVFCPYTWAGSSVKGDEIVFHDRENKDEMVIDMGSDRMEMHANLARNEVLAENMRLLYVALTRAQKQCYLIWGRINQTETSALAYLLHHSGHENKDTLVADLSRDFKKKSKKQLFEELEALTERSDGTIQLVPIPRKRNARQDVAVKDSQSLQCRRFEGKIDAAWRISSYSSLISRRIKDADMPDRDGQIFTGSADHHPEPEIEKKQKNIFSFPKGSKAGNFFHHLFEHVDFQAAYRGELDDYIKEELSLFGFDRNWKDTVARTVEAVLSVPLEDGERSFRLSSITTQNRIHEMEFVFPVKPFTRESVKHVFSEHGRDDTATAYARSIESLSFVPTEGLMKGYIDLIFKHQGRYFIIDWKSNFLGPALSHYDLEALRNVMHQDFYFFQYHLYALALHRFLTMRIPDYRYQTHFGGIFYVFLRGIDAAGGNQFGIFSDLPAYELIRGLDDVMAAH
jgi:exodeoxyribonuclease V beta subunit